MSQSAHGQQWAAALTHQAVQEVCDGPLHARVNDCVGCESVHRPAGLCRVAGREGEARGGRGGAVHHAAPHTVLRRTMPMQAM